ncbi:DUF6252 family protein [Myroides indicus]|uniref:Uncharacterized protein n=1 Tax=Myroides indicus TaxID=1323422 RepID=A0A4R7EVM9_9FLAO|nr:DUF6252 family protein [Myroides indicus]TDS57241.1 hypothetical protein C8P70_11657 [Myroides indicus]
MKRVILLSAICLSFLTTTLFTSCDKESSNSNLDNPELVGKPYFTVLLKDSAYVRDDVKAQLTNKGALSIVVSKLGKEEKDVLQINLLKFQEGSFPTNVNVAIYLYGEEIDEHFDMATSQDPERPEWKSGMVKINRINKEAKVIDGTFKIEMLPNTLNINHLDNFTIEGEFGNLPYERATSNTSGSFLYTLVDGEPLKDLEINTIHNSDTNQITFNAFNPSYRNQNLKLQFPVDIQLGDYTYEDFSVSYTSLYGVKYFSNNEDSALNGSYLKIDKIEDVFQENKTFKRYYGRFDFKLREDRGTHVLQMTEGEFVARVEIQKPEQPPVIEL